jgi:hypothetical protein
VDGIPQLVTARLVAGECIGERVDFIAQRLHDGV